MGPPLLELTLLEASELLAEVEGSPLLELELAVSVELPPPLPSMSGPSSPVAQPANPNPAKPIANRK
jgi:hypothetical protein